MAPGRKLPKQVNQSSTPTALVQNDDVDQGSIVAITANQQGGNSAKSQKRRGLSRGFSREKRSKLCNNVFELRFPEDKWGVVGRDADVFTSELGIIVRMKAPLDVPFWSDMTNEEKEPIFVYLSSTFGLNFGVKHVRDVTDFLLQGRYSDYRGQLYKYIRSFPSIDEARKNPYNDIKEATWNVVCDYVMSDKFQARSKVNKLNRSRVKSNHCSGSKSFLRRREELKDKNVGRIEFYKLTHCKDGVWANEHTKENYNKMVALKEKPVPEGSAPLSEDQICDQVLGITPGYVSGLGRAERRKPSSTNEAYQTELEEARKIAEQAQKNAEQAEKKSEQLQEEVLSQQATIANLTEKIEKHESLFNLITSRMFNGSSSNQFTG